MACACSKGRAAAGGSTTAVAGTFRVLVGGRQVYESTNESAAQAVAARFPSARILKPGESA